MFCGGAPAHFNIKAMCHWFQRNVTIAYLCSFPEAYEVRYGWFPNVEKTQGGWNHQYWSCMNSAGVPADVIGKCDKFICLHFSWSSERDKEIVTYRCSSWKSHQSGSTSTLQTVPEEQVFNHHMKCLQRRF